MRLRVERTVAFPAPAVHLGEVLLSLNDVPVRLTIAGTRDAPHLVASEAEVLSPEACNLIRLLVLPKFRVEYPAALARAQEADQWLRTVRGLG